MINTKTVWIVAALAILLPCLSFAQTAQVTGTVRDASGAIIAGAEVVVRNTGTSVERTTTTGDLGLYTVPLLPPGSYDITARHAGFKPVSRTGVVLAVDQRAELNFTMEVGAVTEKVEVKATAIQLNTVEASQGQVIENQRIVEMPLNGRYYGDLALVSAGAVQAAGGTRFTGGFSTGGQRVTQNNYLLDGIDNNSVEIAAAGRRAEMVQPSVDAVQEFKVQTNGYAAEFGRGMGGVVNLTLKSGTNDLHGSAFEFLRNEKMDAKNFFTPATQTKPPFKRNQYGLAAGGPVFIPGVYNGKGKTFFFGDFESTRQRQSTPVISTIPTLRMRTGDFGELSRRINDPTTGQPFTGNLIPQSRMDPVARTLIGLYPNPVSAALGSNFNFISPQVQDVDRWDVRLDQTVGSKDNAFFRISRQDVSVPDTPNLPAPAFGGGNLDYVTLGWNTGAGWNHIFTPSLIMSARAGWNYALFERNNPVATKGELLNAKYGIKGGDTTLPGGFSQVNVTGYRALGIGGFNPVSRDSQNRQVSGDLTWIHGRHTFKFGSGLLKSQNNIYNVRNVMGDFTFNGQYTGDGEADLLLGYVQSWNWNTPVNVRLRTYNFSLYAQDDWRISDRLTVNLGVRYEISPPWLELRNRMGIFDVDTTPGKATLIAAKDGSRYDRALVSTDTNNFMPRVGFAFKLTDTTVIRSGYGLFYQYMEPFGDNEFLIGNPPNAFGVTPAGSTTAPAFLLTNGPPAGSTDLSKATSLTFSSFERNLKQASAHQWNFNIQRQLASDWLVEAGYSGSHGIHLVRQYDGNFSPPGPGGLNTKRPYTSVQIPGTSLVVSPLATVIGHRYDGNSLYHALLVKVEKRFSSGFTVLSNYTFSKNIGDTCGGAPQGNATGCGYQDPRYMNLERSLDNQDVPHRFVSSGLYDLPFGKGRKWGGASNPVLQGVFGGWTLGSIVIVSSGVPFTPTVTGNPANTGSQTIVNRPDVVGPAYSGARTVGRDFNTDAFVRNQAFKIGNSGRNVLRQRSFFNWDFSALKNFQIHEAIRLQFRFEAFHFSNTPRFGIPGNQVGAANFGQITSADVPRNLQLGLKLIF